MLLSRASCHFGTITPALLHILATVEEYARFHDLTVVALSGTDGAHPQYSGHDRGEAVDLKVAGLSDAAARQFLTIILARLGPSFYGEIQHKGTAAQQFHLQLRRGVVYHAPPVPEYVNRFNHRG